MAQGEFNMEECDNAEQCVKDLVEGIPKTKRGGFIGEMNDLFLFIAAAKKAVDQLDAAKAAGFTVGDGKG